MTVLLNALRGGPIQWVVSFNAIDYTDSLISVTGISRKAQLDGSFTSATVTITLYGAENNIEIGLPVAVDFMDGSAGLVHLWTGSVSGVNKTSYSTLEVTCIGALSKLNKDISLYYPRGATPRELFKKALDAALSFSVTVPAYNDNYHRGDTRVSTKYSTLANLSGVASYGSPTIASANWGSGTYTNSWSLTLSNSYHFYDVQKWNTFLDTESPSGSAPANALAWHQVGYGIELSMYAFDTPGSSSLKSYWPVGQDKYYNTYVSAYKNSSYYDSLGFTYQDSEGVERVGTYLQVAPSESNKDSPNQTITSWKTIANGNLHTNWNPSNFTSQDSRSYKKQLSTVTNGAIKYGYMSNFQFDGELIYNHVDCSSSLTSKISSASNLGHRYNCKQTIYPVTITADDVTWKIAEEAAWLGSVALVENGSTNGVKAIDTCPEKGSIYEIPICPATCSSVTFVQNNPLPTTVKANFKTPWNKDYSYIVNMQNVSVKAEKELNICQGMIKGMPEYDNYAGANNISPTGWHGNPGFCQDRWTGCNPSSYFNIFSSGYGVTLQVQGSDGTVQDLSQNLYNGRSGYEPSWSVGYCVREKDGTEYYPFAGRIYISSPYYMNKNPDPWLDIFPINQLKDANNRVFVDKYRPSWKVEVPLAFVNCEPGQVVVVDLKEITSEPYLAMVISNECSSDKPTVTLEILPMFVAVGASSSDWPNIGDVLNIATSLSAPTIGKPYIPATLLTNNTQPEPVYDHTLVVDSSSVFSGTEWWYPLRDNNLNEQVFALTPNAEIHVYAENYQTGFKSEWIITRENWINAHLDYGQWYERKCLLKGLSDALFGTDDYGTGLIFYQNFWNPQEARLVFNTATVPALTQWKITFKWNDAEPITYYDSYLKDSGWLHTNAYSYTSTTGSTQNVVGWKENQERVALLITGQSGSITMLPCTSRTSASDTLNYFYFQLPTDGVYSEMRVSINRGQTTSFRFTIASAFRDSYPSSSTFADDIFGDDYKPLTGAKIELIKWRY